jgi:hypothetical protein
MHINSIVQNFLGSTKPAKTWARQKCFYRFRLKRSRFVFNTKKRLPNLQHSPHYTASQLRLKTAIGRYDYVRSNFVCIISFLPLRQNVRRKSNTMHRSVHGTNPNPGLRTINRLAKIFPCPVSFYTRK